MDPQTFVRLSVGQLGLRLPAGKSTAGRACHCEIRLRGFPAQTAPVPLLTNSSELILDPHGANAAAVFSLDESDLAALSAPGCFSFRVPAGPCLEIAVYLGSSHVGGGMVAKRRRRRLVGVVRVGVGPEWREGKPVVLRHGWTAVGGGGELHLRVKAVADPRYVFRFEDEVALNPQVVQIHGRHCQPIFSCKFIRAGRRASQADDWSSCSEEEEKEMETARRKRMRERKGWKVAVHDLSGTAVAAAFMATPFVPATGRDTVARSNPGAWLIVRADTTGSSDSWQPWGRLEAWREDPPAPGTKGKDSAAACLLRLRLLPEQQREDACVLVSETPLSCEKGGEFSIDMDRHSSSEEPEEEAAEYCAAGMGGGFVMSCRVHGEASGGPPVVVRVAARHVTCMEDAAMFLALAAAVDLSVKACRPFPGKSSAPAGKTKKKLALAAGAGSSSPDPLDLDT